MTCAKTSAAVVAAALLIAPAAFAQSASSTVGKPGTPGYSDSVGTPAAQSQTGITGGSSMPKAGDTPGNSGALGKSTAEQHEKLGN